MDRCRGHCCISAGLTGRRRRCELLDTGVLRQPGGRSAASGLVAGNHLLSHVGQSRCRHRVRAAGSPRRAHHQLHRQSRCEFERRRRSRHRHSTICFRHAGAGRTGGGRADHPRRSQQGVRRCNVDCRIGPNRLRDIGGSNRHCHRICRSYTPGLAAVEFRRAQPA